MNKQSPLRSNVESMPIAVRAYVRPFPSNNQGEKSEIKLQSRKKARTSDYSLIFDCETTTDATQKLRFGSYQFRKRDEFIEEGLFFNADALGEREVKILQNYAETHGLKCRSAQEFVEDVLFYKAYERRAAIIGFNLPFDISRLAVKCGSARGKTMKGGFTFTLSENKRWPHIQIKHLSSHNSLIQFTKPPRWVETRSERRKFGTRPPKRGAFIDVNTLARALLSQSFNLGSLSDFLGTENRKAASDAHGARLTRQYIDYCRNDVQATWECYQALLDRYSEHGLTRTEASKILSEASLGKAYFREMGIRPFREMQRDFPDDLFGKILSAYYGGRSEVRWRRTVKQVLYCDFLSMYPTVFTLMGLWRFVIAQGVDRTDATDETRHFVENLALSDLQTVATWKGLSTLVRVAPKADIFPVRARYADAPSYTIGLNFLSSEQSLWYTLADVIASKLLTGKTPRILEAISFSAREPQAGLKPIRVAGKAECAIDPVNEEFFKRIIDLRATVKRDLKQAKGAEKDRLDSEQLALKILANATSYGIFVEVNVSDLDKREQRICFGPGERFEVDTDKDEEPGRYFHPLLATLITGAARLMLAISEALILEKGLEWAFCDTDSMAIAKPDEMEPETFIERAESVCGWFAPLNPYEQKGFLFKIEDQNYSLDASGELEALYCLAVSAKRYVLFNRTHSEIVIRKASAHGLGHLLSPYSDADAPKSIPAPSVELSYIGLERWQYDLWYEIVKATLAGHGEEVDFSYHPALNNPAASRYGATTTDLLRWFKTTNENRPYADQIKPFNFLLCFQSVANFWEERHGALTPKRGRRPKKEFPKPVASYDRDISRASRNAFDRITGKPVSPDTLKTYAQALAQYHLSPEMKFENGEHFDRGLTVRRHIHASSISHVGKEANRWEQQFFTGPSQDTQIEYGASPDFALLDRHLKEMCKAYGERATAKRCDISRGTLRKARQEECASLSPRLRKRIINGLDLDSERKD